MNQRIVCILFLLFPIFTWAENLTQTIRGVVLDKQSKSPLIGATVVVLNSDPLNGTTTDLDGGFRLDGVPVGRASIQISFLGYNSATIPNIIVSSAKEVILNIELEERITSLKEVVVTAKQDKKEAINKMATVSSRSFTVEETQRYAGSLNDPSRMATNYAGVGTAGDSRNDIVIRGNSPLGLLWRLDGVNIPNPNHFGSLGTTGGPVSILNNNLLANSDFMTGAFPSEYGNALSGAFDLNLRNGNNETHEYMGQIGFNGFELGAEGPFSKKSKASYLANFRYSTLELLEALGINFGYGSIPQYQDGTIKIDIPTGLKYGRFSLFAIGGHSYIELLDSEKEDGDFSVTGDNEDTYFGSDMGAVGLSHTYFFNETTRSKLSLAISGVRNKITVDSLFNENTQSITIYGNKSNEVKYSAVYNLYKKFNAKNNIQLGGILDLTDFNYADSTFQKTFYRQISTFSGNAALMQYHAQWQHRFSDVLTLNLGGHFQWFSLNKSWALEPRAGIKWNFVENQSFSLGAGMHSQLQPMSIYFANTRLPDGSYQKTNKELELSKSNHFVFGYDNHLTTDLRVKFETYYQQLYDIPVEEKRSYYSILNAGADFGIPSRDSLVNEGTGENYGIELTIEKFFSKNYYFLITGSLFDSKYKGSDNIERNTAFNGNYSVNALAGVEFQIGRKKRNTIQLNVKTNWSGGKRYVPIDLEKSKLAKRAIYDTKNAYANRYADYIRTDAKLGFKLNGQKITQEWAFDVQNIFDRKNMFQQIYKPSTNEMVTENQLGFFPMFMYRILF